MIAVLAIVAVGLSALALALIVVHVAEHDVEQSAPPQAPPPPWRRMRGS